MATLQNTDVFHLFMAQLTIRRASRTLDFAEFTMEDAKAEALAFLGGDAVDEATGKIKDTSAPVGKLDELAIMEQRVKDIIEAALSRGSS